MIKILLQIFILTSIYVLNSSAFVCNGIGEIRYDKALYTGECIENKKDGRGRIVFDDGVKYEGDWKNDKKNGHGTQHYANGMIYNGEWKNGIYHGKGSLKYNSKEKYDGHWDNGKKDGQGTYTYASGVTYSGNWKADRKDGYGVIKYANGVVYKGDFVNDLKEGKGLITYLSGDKYDGGFYKEKHHGYGVFTFAKGGSYAGEWRMGKRTGKGKYTYTSGAVYDGMWLNDKKHGDGKYTDAQGSVYVGSWKKNKKHGHGVLTHKSGERYDGQWRDDKKDSQGVLTYASGRVYNGGFKDDKKDGSGLETNQYGTCRGVWKNGELVSLIDDYTYGDAYKQFNEIRRSADMIELRYNPILQSSAQNHSKYIDLHNTNMNRLGYHHEKYGKKGFTGLNTSDRAIKAGYFSRGIGEGISNYCSAESSINSLMTTIYHRFEILTFDKDEYGIGFTQDSKSIKRNFVHNTGNSNLNILCQSDDYWIGDYFSKVCADEKLKIKIDPYNKAKDKILEMNPKYVIWPVDGSVDNLYYFKDDVPNPMPEFIQTGNPISIQFNPYFFPDNVVVYSFRIFKGKEEITETKLLTKQTDPNKKFTKHQYALFPLEPLERDTEYKVVIKYKYNGTSKRISSSFRTKK